MRWRRRGTWTKARFQQEQRRRYARLACTLCASLLCKSILLQQDTMLELALAISQQEAAAAPAPAPAPAAAAAAAAPPPPPPAAAAVPSPAPAPASAGWSSPESEQSWVDLSGDAAQESAAEVQGGASAAAAPATVVHTAGSGDAEKMIAALAEMGWSGVSAAKAAELLAQNHNCIADAIGALLAGQ